MAKRQPRKRSANFTQIFEVTWWALLFFCPFFLAIAALTLVFNWILGENSLPKVMLGVAIPCAFALLYRWRAGKWFTFEE